MQIHFLNTVSVKVIVDDYNIIMCPRSILCTLYGALDFLNSLKKGCCGGGGCYWYIMKYFMYLEVIVGKKYWYVMYTQQHTTTLHNSTRVHKTTNVPVVFTARYVMILRGATSLLRALEVVGPPLPMPLVVMLHTSKSLRTGP
jgi:hypothetical protein